MAAVDGFNVTLQLRIQSSILYSNGKNGEYRNNTELRLRCVLRLYYFERHRNSHRCCCGASERPLHPTKIIAILYG